MALIRKIKILIQMQSKITIQKIEKILIHLKIFYQKIEIWEVKLN